MHLFTVELTSQPGELARLGETLDRRGVHPEAGGATIGGRGVVYLTANNEDAARSALDGANLPYAQHPALQVKCPDRPGEVGRFVRKLADADINVEGLLPISITGGEVVFATCVDKPDEARRILGEQVIG
ncbi:hypothetical protein ACNTMW_34095 [Planosporangium sp. 12N6]|uniref:hypothetical protein n=1 Tax=Planosporangium spinosum TaxID=3402278 RepID=UPI003CF390EE